MLVLFFCVISYEGESSRWSLMFKCTQQPSFLQMPFTNLNLVPSHFFTRQQNWTRTKGLNPDIHKTQKIFTPYWMVSLVVIVFHFDQNSLSAWLRKSKKRRCESSIDLLHPRATAMWKTYLNVNSLFTRIFNSRWDYASDEISSFYWSHVVREEQKMCVRKVISNSIIQKQKQIKPNVKFCHFVLINYVALFFRSHHQTPSINVRILTRDFFPVSLSLFVSCGIICEGKWYHASQKAHNYEIDMEEKWNRHCLCF